MNKVALREIAPPKSSSIKFGPQESVWQLGLEHIEADTGQIVERVESPAAKAGNSTYVFDEGNVLYSKLRPYLNKVHCPDGPGIATTELVPLRPKKDRLDKRYLTFYLRSPMFVSYISGQVSGAKMPRVNMDKFWQHEIPLPPLDEQKRIAAILDKSDALRRKRTEATRLTNDFLQSVFLDMFGDPVANPKGWVVKDLGAELEFLTSGSRGWAQHYAAKGDVFLRIQNVGRNAMLLDDVAYVRAPDTAEAKRTRVQPGDVLLSITADLGRTGVVPEGLGAAYINQHLGLLRTKTIEPFYLSAYLASEGGQRQIRSLNRNGVKAGLNFDDIRSLKILLPDLASQKTFAAIHQMHQKLCQRMRQAMSVCDDVCASLVQRAFQGEL